MSACAREGGKEKDNEKARVRERERESGRERKRESKGEVVETSKLDTLKHLDTLDLNPNSNPN